MLLMLWQRESESLQEEVCQNTASQENSSEANKTNKQKSIRYCTLPLAINRNKHLNMQNHGNVYCVKLLFSHYSSEKVAGKFTNYCR